MRLWHYKLIPYLPNSQLIAQWRELNSIFKNQPKHILINYVYEYSKKNLSYYTALITVEMFKRNIKMSPKAVKQTDDYFGDEFIKLDDYVRLEDKNPFSQHHTDRYLKQCFYNLQEKYDRGQKDFSKEQYKKLEEFIYGQIKI